MPTNLAYWKQAFHKHGALCVYCKKQRFKFSVKLSDYLYWSIDHLVPLSKKIGGCNHPDNIVPACIVCNMYKKDEVLDDPSWFEARIIKGTPYKFVKADLIDTYITAIKSKIIANKLKKRGEFKAFKSYIKKTPKP